MEANLENLTGVSTYGGRNMLERQRRSRVYLKKIVTQMGSDIQIVFH